MERRDKVNYYLDLAQMVAQRSTCLRRHYGAVIVKNDEVISTGYVGAPRGRKNCTDVGECIRQKMEIPRGERYELCRSVHAETNAIISASRDKMIGSAMYLTGVEAETGEYVKNSCSCSMCKRQIINAGIETVYVRDTEDEYRVIPVQQWIDGGRVSGGDVRVLGGEDLANRAYLYAKKDEAFVAISEYNYDIPIAYKILVSCKTKRVRSSIFGSPFKIALRGNFEEGVERLYAFLEELKQKGLIPEAELDEKIEETKTFLEKQRGCRFFWLEGAEIYEYGGPALFGNLKMHRRISRIGTEIANFYRELDGVKPDERMGMIGIQEWADCLYYETD